MVRIALVQMRCEKGEIAENLQNTAEYLEQAKANNIDFVCFPEMSVSGYADPTRYPQAVLRQDGPEVRELLEISRGFTGVLFAGIIEENPEGKPFITQLIVQNGTLLRYYRKITIKDEEAEWFTPGESVPVFRFMDLTYGLAICADIGNESVFDRCAGQGASIVFELAAPGLYGSQETRNWQTGYEWWEGECNARLGGYAEKYRLWIPVATQAGRTIDEDFPGGGYLFAPDGRRVFATADWGEGINFLEVDLSSGKVVEL